MNDLKRKFESVGKHVNEKKKEKDNEDQFEPFCKIRKLRGKQDRIFLVGYKKIDNNCIIFNIMGTTGNIYDISIMIEEEDKSGLMKWSCNCPDFKIRRRNCKHIYFCQDKLLNCKSSFDGWEKALNFINTSISCKSSDYVAPSKVIAEFTKLITTPEVKQKTINTGDICCICLDDMYEKDELIYCKYGCGNSNHLECHLKWLEKNNTCPYCRMTFFNETQTKKIQQQELDDDERFSTQHYMNFEKFL